MRRSAITISMTALFLFLTSGCENKAKQLEEAKEAHADALSTVAAFAPFLKLPKGETPGLVQREAALFALDKIVAATAAAARVYSLVTPTGANDKSPKAKVGGALRTINTSCTPLYKGKFDAHTTEACSFMIEPLLTTELRDLGEMAASAGLPADAFPGKLDGWLKPGANATAEKLAALVREPGPGDKVTALWASPTSTWNDLDAACKEALDATKKPTPSGGQPNSRGDADATKLEVIAGLSSRASISRCLGELGYKIADELFGPCFEDPAKQTCFSQTSCGLADKLRAEMKPQEEGDAAEGKETIGVPAFFRDRAAKIVERCTPYL
jgi:hypothetical protein